MFSRLCPALAMIACCAPAGVHAEPRPDVDWQVGGHTFRVREIAVSPDGLRAASGAEDGSLKIWDIASGKLELTVAVPSEFSSNNAAIFGVSFDPSGDSVWGASVGGAYEWDTHTGAFLRAIGAVETGEQIFFSRDGEYLGLAGSASGFDDDTYVYRRSDGAFLHMFEPAGSVAATFTADSAYLIAGSAIAFQQMSGDIRYYRMSDGGLERTIGGAHVGAINWIELSPDGTEFASCGDDGMARLWNVADGALRHTLSGHTGPIQRVHYSPDGAEIATSSHDGTIRVWDAQSGAFLRMMTPLGGEGVGPLAWTSDGASMIVSAGSHFGSPSPHIRKIAATDGALQKQFTHFERQFTDLAMAPDGSRVAMSVYPARVHVFDATDGTPLWISPDDSLQNFIAFTPDSAQLAIGRANGVVDFRNATDGALMGSFVAHNDKVVDVAFSPNGQLMLTRSDSGVSTLWNFPSLTMASTLSATFTSSAGSAFSPDSATIAIGVAGIGVTSLFRTTDGGFLRSFSGHEYGALSLDFNAPGTLLATASIDRTVKLWDVATGGLVRTLGPVDAWVRSVAFSRDGAVVASGTIYAGRSLRLWDVESGTELVNYTIDIGSGAQGIVYSPDNQRIFVGRSDGALVAFRNPLAFGAGDVNADGAVDALDAQALASALVGEPMSPGDMLRADVNRDGHADGGDLSAWLGIALDN